MFTPLQCKQKTCILSAITIYEGSNERISAFNTSQNCVRNESRLDQVGGDSMPDLLPLE